MAEQVTWVYIQSERHLYTVGFYDAKGVWHTDSDHESKELAAERVHHLNGGTSPLAPTIAQALQEMIDTFYEGSAAQHSVRIKAIDLLQEREQHLSANLENLAASR